MNQIRHVNIIEKTLMQSKAERGKGKTYVGVELANKAREVVVLEIIWKQILRKIRMFPHHKSVATLTPRYHLVRRRIVHQLICLRQERRRHRSLRHFFPNYPSPTSQIYSYYSPQKRKKKKKKRNNQTNKPLLSN